MLVVSKRNSLSLVSSPHILPLWTLQMYLCAKFGYPDCVGGVCGQVKRVCEVAAAQIVIYTLREDVNGCKA